MTSIKKSLSAMTKTSTGHEIISSLSGFFKVVIVIIVLVVLGSLLLRLFTKKPTPSGSSTSTTTAKTLSRGYASQYYQGYPGQVTPPPEAWWMPSRSSLWYWDWLYDPYYDYYWNTWYPEYHHHHHHYPTSAPTVAPTAAPTVAPTAAPTVAPTAAPTVAPTAAPTTDTIPTDAPLMPEPTLAGLNILPTIPLETQPEAIEPPMITFAIPTFGDSGLPTMPSASGINMPTTLDVPDIIIQEPAIPTFGGINIPSVTIPQLQIPAINLSQPPAMNQPVLSPVMNQPVLSPAMNQPVLSPAMNQPVLSPAMNVAMKEGFANNPSCLLNMKPTWNIKEYVNGGNTGNPEPSDYATTNFEKSNW